VTTLLSVSRVYDCVALSEKLMVLTFGFFVQQLVVLVVRIDVRHRQVHMMKYCTSTKCINVNVNVNIY